MDLGAQGPQVSHLQGAGWVAAALLRIISENVDSSPCMPPLIPDTPLLPYVPRTHSPTRPGLLLLPHRDVGTSLRSQGFGMTTKSPLAGQFGKARLHLWI